MDGLLERYTAGDVNVSAIFSEGCVQRGKWIALNVQITPEMFRQRIGLRCNLLCEAVHRYAAGKCSPVGKLGLKAPINKHQPRRGAFHAPLHQVRYGEVIVAAARQAEGCACEPGEAGEAPVFIAQGGKSD